MRKLRLTALILVFAGLLIGGVGIGMCFVEASSFTYGGDSRLEMTVTGTASEIFSLDDGQKLTGYTFWNILSAPDAEVPQVETNAKLAPGIAQMDVEYRTVPGCTLDLWASSYDGQTVEIGGSPSVGTEAILYAKDQLLSDIKNRQIGEYQWVEITGITFTVNPTDRDRLDLSPFAE